MKHMNALALLLRASSAGAKFLFIVYLAAKTDSSLLGKVAVLMTIATVFAQIAGLELNQVIGRQLHALSDSDRFRLLRRQAQTALAAYCLLLPATLFFYNDLLSGHWIGICGIFMLEHFLIEVYRYNILKLRPTYASGILFIKNAGWIILFIALVEAEVAQPSLGLLVYCWFGTLALTAAPLLLRYHSWTAIKELLSPSDWHKQSAKLVWEARSFIVSAFAMAGIGAVDKLLIAEKFTAAELGIYFFFATCTSVISLITSFSIGATLGPRCIKTHTTRGRAEYLNEFRHLKKMYWLTTIAAALAITLPAATLLSIFDKADYLQHINVLYILTPAAALIVLCEPYKMDAYLERRDLALTAGNIFHLCCLTVCVALFATKQNIAWVAIGVLLASLLTYLYFLFDIGHIAQRLRPFASQSNLTRK